MARKKDTGGYSAVEFVDNAMHVAQEKFGERMCYVAADHEQYQLVLPVPHISLRWLIESNGWPIGRYALSSGDFGTFKSTFLFQLMCWYIQAGGFVVHVDTENKVSHSLMMSFLPEELGVPDHPMRNRLLMHTARSINEWQQRLEQQLTLVADNKDKIKFPILWAVDSMMGVDAQSSIDKLQADGEAPGRTFSEASLLISNFFRTFTGLMVGLPATLCMTNHEKPDLNSPGGHGVRRAGGKAPDYYATLALRFRKGPFATTLGTSARYEPIPSRDYNARTIQIEVRKSSMGTDNKELNVLVKWDSNYDKVTKKRTQRTWIDWEAATADLLARQTRELEKYGVLDVKRTKKPGIGDMMFSDALGISEKDALPASEFGSLVEHNAELRSDIEGCLGVQQHPEIASVPLRGAADAKPVLG